MTRRRVNISVDEELHGRMIREARRHGFRNLCRLTVAAVRAVLDAADRQRRTRGRDIPASETDDEYISRMFRENADVETEAKGPRPKTGARKSDDL